MTPGIIDANIKTCILIILDYKDTQYISWSTLFQLHCRTYLVIDHIIPSSTPTAASVSTESDAVKAAAQLQWQLLDDIVHQWIYKPSPLTFSTPSSTRMILLLMLGTGWNVFLKEVSLLGLSILTLYLPPPRSICFPV